MVLSIKEKEYLKDITPEKTIDNKIELTKSIGEVQSKIRDVVSSDFVMCKLDPQTKEYVIEMSNNAFLSRRILTIIKNQAKIWVWNNGKYIHRLLNSKEKEYMDSLIQACFDAYMNRIYMITIVNRNVPHNYIIEKISGVKDEVEDEETKLQSLVGKVKDRIGIKSDEAE